MNNKKVDLLKLLSMGVIIITFISCAGENEEGGSKERPPSSDSTSRAISPKKEYTEENPAEWKSVANDHLPEVVFNESKTKDNVTVKLLGKNFSERHYIEVIGIMDEKSADIDIKYLQRGSKPAAVLSLNKKDYDPEKMKVFAKCNLHDLWSVPLVSKEN